MENRNFLSRILALAFSLVLLSYIGFQAYKMASDTNVTVDAVSITATDKLDVQGVFIREQQAVTDESLQGNIEFLVPDGEKISKAQTVALVIKDNSLRERYTEYKEVSGRLEALNGAGSYLKDSTDGSKLNMLIDDSVKELAEAMDKDNIAQIGEITYKIKSLISLQTSSAGIKEEYQKEQKTLENKLKSINVAALDGQAVKSSEAGYFFSYSDGFDEMLMPQNLEQLTCSDVSNAITEYGKKSSTLSGKVVSGFEWYYAIVLNDEQAKRMKDNSPQTINFPNLSIKDIPVTLVRLTKEQENQHIAILKSTYMKEALLATRVQTGEIILNSHKGVKIPKDAIRQKDGKWGVYCLMGNKAVFKEIEWIFETDSYYVVKQAETPQKGLYEYDKIILSSKLIE